jgi:hypothetical protein
MHMRGETDGVGTSADGVGAAVLPLRREPVRPLPRPRRRLLSLLTAVPVLAAGVATLGTLGGSHPPAAAGPPPAESDGQVEAVVLRDWVVAPDPHDRGAALGWPSGGFAGQPVQVPSVVDPHPILGKAGARNYDGSVAWYRTRFEASRAGQYALRFESVNHRASVWVDGRRVGGHVGTYLPFEFHFGAGQGLHTVVARADWRSPALQSSEGFHRTWFNFGGINRAVTVRALGPSQLFGPALQTRLVGSGDGQRAQVAVSVVAHNTAAPRRLSVAGTLTHGDQRISLRFAPHQVGQRASALFTASASIPHPALWAPGHPNLYDLELSVPGETAYRARVGLRQLTWTGGHLMLNGHPIVLRGASLQEDARNHGDALTPTDQAQLVNGLVAIGANATRSQHPLDGGLLARLDAAGILVWQGVGPVDAPGAWTSRTPKLLRMAERRVRATVRQEGLHPSVVAWNLANEVAGNGHPGGEARYVQDMTRGLHFMDPGRMVAIDVWGDHPPVVAGPLYRNVDAIGATNYMGWYEHTTSPPSVVAAQIRHRLAALRATFPGRVLIVSEFGAEANTENPANQPGGYNFQAQLLGLHLNTYQTIPGLSGMLVWDLRDFAVAPSFAGGSIRHTVPGIRLVKGLNQKGLYTYSGRPKPAVAVVRQAFTVPQPRG